MIWRNHKDPSIGDHVAVFKEGGDPGRLTQEIGGLIPGKYYALSYVTTYRKDLVTPPKQRIRHEIVPSIENGEVIPDKVVKENSFHARTQFFRHRIVFRATGTEAKLTLADCRTDRKDGDILLNAVAIRPYFEN